MTLKKLSIGNTGPDVKAVQQALNVWGAKPSLGTDSKFGNKTDTAVRQFQKAKGLTIDGIVGKDTRGALFPVGVATVTLVGTRLRPDSGKYRGGSSLLSPGTLKLDEKLQQQVLGFLNRPAYKPVRFSPLTAQLHAPAVPEWTLPDDLLFPPQRSGSSPSLPFGIVYDHRELQPGATSTFQFDGTRQDMFVLSAQTVYRRGPADGGHQEPAAGVQFGTPLNSPNGPWTVNPYIQLTDVDRFGALGSFHWWQPYAQAGFQFTGLGNPKPALTAALVPLNLGMDVGELLTVSLMGGLAFSLDLKSGKVQAGAQFGAGLTLKLGKPNSPLW